ncbi:MAG: hypothetical protein IPM79_19460 [Polyangiaceae bacterium]|jgi:hypothetical protein|nr:hypothetical protein [Polyangiaceae bacterium]
MGQRLADQARRLDFSEIDAVDEMITRGKLSVSVKRVSVDVEAARQEPCMSGDLPFAEVDVSIDDRVSYTHNPDRVWWQMLLSLLPGRTAFIYEPTLGARGYLDRWRVPWVRSHVELWPDQVRPLEVARVDEQFLVEAGAQSEENWLSLMNAVVHATASSVLIHQGPSGQAVAALSPLALTISTEHEWNGGRFYFYDEGLGDPLEFVASAFDQAVSVAPVRWAEDGAE